MRIRTEAELDAAFTATSFLLCKLRALPDLGRRLRALPALVRGPSGEASGWIDVLAERGLAQAAAERTGVRLHSP